MNKSKKCQCGKDFDSYSINEDLINGLRIENAGYSGCGLATTISVKRIKRMVHLGGEK